MDKFIGFDVDHKHTVACITQADRPDRFTKLKTEVSALRAWLQAQRCPGGRLHLTFEVSGLSGLLYDGLVDVVDHLEASNPTKLTWIYRTAKKNDRINALITFPLTSETSTVHSPAPNVRWPCRTQT